jgi:hypothetical protein
VAGDDASAREGGSWRTTSRDVGVGFRCEITVRGRLSRTLVAEFEELSLAAATEPVETVLTGEVEDQAALHGLLRRSS